MAKADNRIDSLPILTKEEHFEEWKRDITIWKAITSIDKSKQGPVLYRSLAGQAKKSCSNIKIEDICSANGYDLIMNKLEEVFAKDNEQKAFEYCREFETFKRAPEMKIVEYITEFERLYDKIQVHDMKYADSVLAYKLLINANISEEKQSMCRATMGKLTFENIKRQLKVIHDATGTDTQTSIQSDVVVKEEPVFEAEHSYSENFYAQSNRGFWRGNGGPRTGSRGAYRGNYGFRGNQKRNMNSVDQEQNQRRNVNDTYQETLKQRETGTTRKKTNPLDKYGRITKCSVCQSIYHWARDCPDREEDQISLFTNEEQMTYLPQFLQETVNCAILDCGCVKSVCGKLWFQIYTETLTNEETNMITEEPSTTRFRFGVGGPVYISERKVKFPAVIGDKNVTMVTICDNGGINVTMVTMLMMLSTPPQ